MRRKDVALMSVRRHYDIMCMLGSSVNRTEVHAFTDSLSVLGNKMGVLFLFNENEMFDNLECINKTKQKKKKKKKKRQNYHKNCM